MDGQREAESGMLWYVIQTYTGKEEQLVKMIRRQLPKECYGECFVAYYEQLRDRKQENQIHILRLFPGYIFISCGDIERLFQYLKMIPAMSKIMAAGAFVFTPVYEGEAEFLMKVMDSDHVVRLTYVATDGRDHISYMSGPLQYCEAYIQSYRFRDRYANVRLQIAGQEKIARMGIILNDDVRREMAYGKVEALIRTPEKYVFSAASVMEEHAVRFEPGDKVAVVDGTFEGNVAVIRQAKKSGVRISVQMFDREILLEVPAESVRKLA